MRAQSLPSLLAETSCCACRSLANSGLCGPDPIPYNDNTPDDGPLPVCLFTCVQSDTVCSALGDLYNATNGVGWATNSGWSTAAEGLATDYCSFIGCSCNAGILTMLCVRCSSAAPPG